MDVSLKDLNTLGDEQFEKLIKTLLLSVIGLGVTPFTKGKDGAREATFTGKAPYPSITDSWEGNWIFQVKYADTNLGVDKARVQVQYLIDGELSKLKDYGFIAASRCDNYIYITNVPFTGTANTGLHDYIETKKKEFKVKHFHYWDGEKVMTLVNMFQNVRQTFFPVAGIQFSDKSELEKLRKVFVKPKQYIELKDILKKERIVNIVGQPHVGKSSIALMLGLEIQLEYGLNNTFIVPLIDNLSSIPKAENTIFIFDDLFGDINYEQIGKKTKVINTLIQNNYIIITSRDYIFQEATDNNEITHSLSITPVIIQEGSYSNDQLAEILMNHSRLQFENGLISDRTLHFLEANKNAIITRIRFPHNLQFFVESLTYETVTKKKLDEIIQSSIQIESVIRQWILGQNVVTKNILMLLSIGKFTKIHEIQDICQIQWGYNEEQIKDCLRQSKRIIKDGETIKFIHPSFKSSILNTFLQQGQSQLSSLLLSVVTNAKSISVKKVYRNVVSRIFSQLNVEQIKILLQNENIKKAENVLLWYNFMKLDREMAIYYLLEIWSKGGRKISDRQYSSFIGTKQFMTNDEVVELITYLFSRRNLSPKLIDNLIVIFSFKIRELLNPFLNKLDEKNELDLKLKIRLLASIGSKYPHLAFWEILQFEYNTSLKNKKVLYDALNTLHHSYKPLVQEEFLRMLETEASPTNRNKIERSIKNIKALEL